jgi:hypothetical protein
MIKVIVAMLGARRHYAVPRLLFEAGLLERFFTDSYSGNKPWQEVVLRNVPAGNQSDAVDAVEQCLCLGWEHDAMLFLKVSDVVHSFTQYSCIPKRSLEEDESPWCGF